MKEKWMGLAAGAAAALVMLFAADRGLGLAGFPTEPPLAVAHAPNHTHVQQNIEYSYTLRTNDRGLRYDRIPRKKPSGETRVAVIGDSYTEGLGVAAEQAFPALLEKRFSRDGRRVRFINCGLIGAGIAEYARLLEHAAFGYHPDRVLLVLHMNDVADTPDLSEEDLRTGEGWLLPRRAALQAARGKVKSWVHRLFPRTYALLLGARQKMRRPPARKGLVEDVTERARREGLPPEETAAWVRRLPPELVQETDRDRFDSYLLFHGLLWPNIWLESLDIHNERAEKKWRSAEAMLSHIAKRCRERGIPLAVVYAPSPLQYDPSYVSPSERMGVRIRREWLSEESEFEKRLSAWAASGGLPFLNLTPGFRGEAAANPGSLNFQLDPHWNANGQALAARLVADWLLSFGPPFEKTGE